MGSVCGAIKFVTLEGLNELACPETDVTLKTWTLSHDLKDWEPAGKSVPAGDLWKSKSFCESGLPRLAPSVPVLGFDEPDVVYVVLNDVDHVDVADEFGQVYGKNILRKVHYVLRLDMVQQGVLGHKKFVPGDYLTLPHLVSSEFSAHLQGSKDHQVRLEASETGGSGKQTMDASEKRAGGSRKRRKRRKH
ncbi:hypothetical protein PR202_ga19814 [Eleusine coracana subsp. coracana]|uniref:DUF1618 domain-containing protein n=1 Tax=Eleusine coracana subsp. coracana TaxID=191504 RepID=A0AAV5CWG2_ELECO|nr:hypothetical protein PR202_ga19814 [Eleusine coracana subsp. coracana]